MSRYRIEDILWLIALCVFIPCIFLISPAYTYAFHVKDEFPAHKMEKGSCISQECHSGMKEEKKEFQHKPFEENNCMA